MRGLKSKFFWLTHSKIGWVLISFVWFCIFTAIDRNVQGPWAYYLSLPALAYIVGLVLIQFAYGWVINPIRERKNRKKAS